MKHTRLWLLLLTLNILCVAGQQNVEQYFAEDPLQDILLQTQQAKLQQDMQQRTRSKLSTWVMEQLSTLQDHEQNYLQESFVFTLKKNEYQQFKWNPSKTGNFFIKISIYQMQNNQLLRRTEPSQGQYIIVEGKSDRPGISTHISNVYVLKLVPVQVFGDYIILRFHKQFPQQVIIQVQLQNTQMLLSDGIADGIFKMPAQKIKAIQKQIESNERVHRQTFINEYSILQREQRHQSSMLVITGVQLLAIISTQIVQMFCVKNLIDQRMVI